MGKNFKQKNNIIQFPKLEPDNDLLSNKLDTAYELLFYLTAHGHDFTVMINKEAGNEFFDGDLNDFVLLTSNIDEVKKIYKSKFSIYELTGDELEI